MSAMQTALMITVVTLTACGKKPEAQAPAADTAGTMGGMAMRGSDVVTLMRAHLDSIATMQPAQMATMMPAHQDLASRMMDAMGADMRGRNMAPDAAWTALGDSVRRDLAELRGLSGEGLKARMEAHAAQMRRMMARYDDMKHM